MQGHASGVAIVSQPVPYDAPEQRFPERDAVRWRGLERRSRHPIDRLARSFDELCLQATDRFEIVAHLEAMGYNTPAALTEFGVDDHFELAEAMYVRTPKEFNVHRPQKKRVHNWLAPGAMGLALLATFALGTFSTASVMVPALWILMWSQMGAVLLARAGDELEPEWFPQVLALSMYAGLIGLVVVWRVAPFDVEAAAPAFLWFAMAGLVWGRRRARALALPLVVGIVIGWAAWQNLPAGWVHGITVVVSLSVSMDLMWPGAGSVLGWAYRHVSQLVLPAAYGLGQGLLILSLMWHSPDDAQIFAGAALMLVVLIASHPMLVVLRERLTRLLWACDDPAAFVAGARRSILSYAAVYLVPVAIAGVVDVTSGAQPWFFYWLAFALFGACLAIAVVSWTLGDVRTPGLLFPVAGAAALGGDVLIVLAVLVAAQLALLLANTTRFHRYAVHLL